METIGSAIGRVRSRYKLTHSDSYMTDRYIYSVIMKHAKFIMRRQDATNKILRFNGIFKPLNYVELIDVDATETSCFGISSDCKIKRTKYKLPMPIQGYYGILLRSINTLDYSERINLTYPETYVAQSKLRQSKYVKEKFAWYMDGYLYFPDMEYDAVKILGLFEGDTKRFNCTDEAYCVNMQELEISIPDFIFSEIDNFLAADFGVTLQIPQDKQHDNINIAE